MTDILDEVLNDHNEEKRLVFFKKLLPIVIIISLIVITVMIVNNNNKNNRIKNNRQNGDIFVKAINLENTESNKELAFNTLDSLVGSEDSRVKEIALLEQIAIKLSEKKYPEAKELLTKMIENKNYTEITASYARISWLSLVIDDKDLTTEDKEKLVKYLNYFDDENKPFWATASIMQAIWNIRNNMYVDAEKNLRNLLTSNNAPDLLKDQARALLGHVNFKKTNL
ncbi:MAG TPA: DUF2659 family protein [Rickettsia endosymbiont of Pyrocoelia pectoralis]|nr:DUF2659 family protein [Rickettsia endosymbiont of Pyrocoelia pectoralis]